MPHTRINIHVLLASIQLGPVHSSTGMCTITDDQLPPIVDIVMANT